MSTKISTFRVHYDDGTTLDVDATSPDDARKVAKGRRSGIITKVKVKRT